MTKAAETIGIGRPALSNFLNGKAALSPQMAAKLQRAFGADAEDLMRRQAAYDSAQQPGAGAVSATTRTFVPPFLMATANDLEAWANTHEARDKLAVLLRTLVNSTCGGLKLVDFPGNDDAERPGWDGRVETTEGNPWVPEGVSRWEFGTRSDITEKANEDYGLRTKNTGEAERLRTAYVFVTPRRWRGKAKWLSDRQAEGQWRTLCAWDASDLEQWLEQSIPAQSWFENSRGVSREGVKSLDLCWVEWCADCEPRFTADVFAESISAFGERIFDHLRNQSGEILRIVADSRQEGLAFLSALFSQTDEALQGYRDKVVVFTAQGPLSKLAVGSPGFIPIVASSAAERELAQSGCTLTGFAVEPRTAKSHDASITLSPLSDQAFTTALESLGLDAERISRLERESGKSLTVLRRRLAKSEAIRSPEWSSDEDLARHLVPMMLAGAWTANKDADQYLMAELAGYSDYDQLNRDFVRLLNLEDAPIWSVGSFHGVVSKVDALFGVHQWITEDQIDRFIDIADLVLSEGNPALDLAEDKRWAASVYGKAREVSSPLRKGIAESLVLLSIHGDRLVGGRLPSSPAHKVADLIDKLLEPMTPDRLKSQSSDLRLYAEAAPEKLLDIFERDLSRPDPVVASLMQPIGDAAFQSNDRVGLLWALELLAWQPKWLDRVVTLLAKLAELEPSDNLVNKPSESLQAIFRAWMPQTAAPLKQRIAVLDHLVHEHPTVAWPIAAAQFAPGQQFASPSSKPRWRDYALGFGNGATNAEWQSFAIHCIKTCIGWRLHTREGLAELMRSSVRFPSSYLDQLEKVVVKWADQAQDQDRAWLREQIRISLRMTKRPKSQDALDEKEGNQRTLMARKLFELLEPLDIGCKHAWLFESPWVQESWDELEDEIDHSVHTEGIQAQRISAMREIGIRESYQGMLKLALSGDAARSGGWSVAKALEDQDAHLEFINAALKDGDVLTSLPHQALMSGFLNGVGGATALSLLDVQWSQYRKNVGVKLLCLCDFDQLIWSYAQKKAGTVHRDFWKTVQPSWGKHADEDVNYAVSQLLKAGRPRAAFNFASMGFERIESSYILGILTDLPQSEENSHPHYSLSTHSVQKAFETLNKREALNQTDMAMLEFRYMDILKKEKNGVPNLEMEIEDNPNLFCQLLALVYRPEKDNSKRQFTEAELRAARNANSLLDKFAHIPGCDKSGNLNPDKLINWIGKVQQLCDSSGLRRMGDYHIGQLLSKAPASDDADWPSAPIREVLEQVLNESIEEGFIIGQTNSRGVQLRGEGGAQERKLTAQCEAWAKACDYSAPKVAKTLRRLAEAYELEASWWDRDSAVQRRLGY